ncbi:MAG: nickel-dependent hydrogenase large subunit, partial [Bifidobacteriaceae bacterium]|nr:nickel-dependent hydrogenase large subunit [Bifidobacteriaceae bacterium]
MSSRQTPSDRLAAAGPAATLRLALDQAVDGAGAKVVVRRAASGAVVDAELDFSLLPRLEPLLLGRPVEDVPPLVERLCGVCPAAHHLAGVAALEALHGIDAIPAEASRVRRLLHYGSVLTMHATSFLVAGRGEAAALRRLGKSAMAAAGSPGHFPATAVVGGTASAMMPDAARACLAAAPAALLVAQGLYNWSARRGDGGGAGADGVVQLGGPGRGDGFRGADVALVDGDGWLDPLGGRLRAVGPGGEVVVAGARAGDWDGLVRMERPEAAAPRPYLLVGGVEGGRYRVGPVAQLRAGQPPTRLARELRADWFGRGGGTLAARAVMAVHCVEMIAELAEGEPGGAFGPGGREALAARVAGRVGVGWVDGARGLLVHRYGLDRAGALGQALVLTPTAQNEPWLAQLLVEALRAGADGAALEGAIRQADPCLPCVAAPSGLMAVAVETVAVETVAGAAVAGAAVVVDGVVDGVAGSGVAGSGVA